MYLSFYFEIHTEQNDEFMFVPNSAPNAISLYSLETYVKVSATFTSHNIS